MGGTAKRTEEMGYEKLKPCPGCASLQRPVVSPLGAWGLTVPIHAYITFLDLDFGLEAAQEAECSKVRDGWRYELSVGKENVHIHCELQDRSSIWRMLRSRTTSAWCLLWPGDSQDVMDSGRCGNSRGASLQGQYGLMRETFYS